MADNSNVGKAASHAGRKLLKGIGKIISVKVIVILIIVFVTLILLQSFQYVLFKADTADDKKAPSYTEWMDDGQQDVTYE